MPKDPQAEEKAKAIQEVTYDMSRIKEIGSFHDYINSISSTTDKVFTDFEEDSFDDRNFLVDTFEFKTTSVYAPTTISRVGNGVGIFADTIGDYFVSSGESDSENDFIIYSSICTRQPSVLNAETAGLTNFFDSGDFYIEDVVGAGSGYTDKYQYTYNYYSLERTELHTKYACIPGVTSVDVAPMKGLEFVNDFVNQACLEAYNTVASREFIPQRIKQEPMLQKLSTDSGLGEELQTAEGSSIATPTTTGTY